MRSSIVLFCILLLVGCHDGSDLLSNSTPPASQSVVRASTQETTDEYFERLEQVIPGFGGWYFDSLGNPTVFLKDLEYEATARAVIGPEAAARRISDRDGTLPEPQLKFRKAEYSFSELKNWQRRIARVLDIEGVHFTDVSENENRVTIGAEAAAHGRARAFAVSSGIPDGALNLRAYNGFRRLSGLLPNDSLTSEVRPVPGGVRIQVEKLNSSVEECTLGANVLLTDSFWWWRAAVTASHCGELANPTNSQIFQPFVTSQTNYRVGLEMLDRYSFTNTTATECPSGFSCRWSDAMVFVYDNSQTADIAKLARTTAWGAFRGPTGSVVIDATNPRLTVTQQVTTPVVGEHLDKIGQNTGWTYGDVQHTCAQARPPAIPNFAFLCQTIVWAGSGAGDSGAPVFRNPSGGPNAYLYGFVHGGGTVENSTQKYFVFSPLVNVFRDYPAYGFDFLR